MKITRFGHAAVLVETDRARILIDPGNFTDDWHGLTDLDAILVTHQHADHLDPASVPALLAAHPAAVVLVEPSVVDDVPLPDGRRFAAGDTATVGDVTITGVGGRHAVIHPDLPRIGNTGMVVRAEGEPTFFHPGDALDTIPDGVDIVAVPAYGPWAAMAETVDFARAFGHAHGFCIHDGLLSGRGFDLVHGRLGAMSGLEMLDLRDGHPVTF